MTFSTVSASGFTSVVATDPSPTPIVPGTFQIVNDLRYDVLTTASVSGSTVACFRVPWITDAATFANLRVLHGEDGKFVDRTIMRPDPRAPDFATRRACGQAGSLSPFAIAVRRDTKAPRISVGLTPSILRPADRRLVTVTARIHVRDDTDPSPTVRLLSIASNQPGTEDIEDAAIGTDDRQFRLRAARTGRKARVYTVVYRATDRSGNSRDVSAYVIVPAVR